MKLKKTIAILLFLNFFYATGYSAEKPTVLSGKTMGTTWRVVLAPDEKSVSTDINNEIVQKLKEVNKSMSLFDVESELSKFNKYSTGKDKFCTSEEFISLFLVGKKLYELTNGAWDGTIGPLVNLWGFGITKREGLIPSDIQIKDSLKNTGFNRIRIYKKHCLEKDLQGMVLDYGSIAKGYGIDVITELLRSKTIKNFLVEIGGEVYASGRKKGTLWKVGIKMPDFLPLSTRIYKAVKLENMAIATSGDYRNFREINGEIISHIINPATGYPVKNKVASVSVTALSTAFADGLATAIMVMGVADGLLLVNSLKDVECLIIKREKGGRYSTYTSSGWEKNYLKGNKL